MKHLDLCSGVGGFALAASWVWPEHEVASNRKQFLLSVFVAMHPIVTRLAKRNTVAQFEAQVMPNAPGCYVMSSKHPALTRYKSATLTSVFVAMVHGTTPPIDGIHVMSTPTFRRLPSFPVGVFLPSNRWSWAVVRGLIATHGQIATFPRAETPRNTTGRQLHYIAAVLAWLLNTPCLCDVSCDLKVTARGLRMCFRNHTSIYEKCAT